MELHGLTESEIREGATAESFRRGQEYYEDGAVLSIARRGDVVEAEVEGSQPEPYNVRVELDDGEFVEANCDCPYSWGGWCKHIVAVLLFCLEQPGELEERQPLDQLLSGLDREQLQSLLIDLAEEQPRLAALVESRVALITATSSPQAASSAVVAPVDLGPFRRQVRDALRGLGHMRPSEAYWHVGEIVDEVRGLLDRALALAWAGDSRASLTILEAATVEYLAGWESLDDSDGEASGFFYDLGRAWAETLLSVGLTTEERRAWTDKLEGWQVDLEDYGLDDALDLALEAAEQGWDFPPLKRILSDGITDLEEPEVEETFWDSELITVRLGVLDRQSRHTEYLNLAKAAERQLEYATMLVRLGRMEEAMEYGLGELATADDAEALAKVLWEHENLDLALEMAQHGLTLEGGKASLADWLCDLAAGMGKTDVALSAAMIALSDDPSLASYLRAQRLAGEEWPDMRGEVLDRLRRAHLFRPDGQVDIFLHEGLLDEAIAVVERTADYRLVERVVDAAMDSRPEWVIQACRAQAEPIMDEGRAQYYDAAAKWIAKAGLAYQAAGREGEWHAYLDTLLDIHRRKYKLVPLLKKLAA